MDWLHAIRAESGDNPALDAEVLSLEGDFDNRVLRLRVVDPAMVNRTGFLGDRIR